LGEEALTNYRALALVELLLKSPSIRLTPEPTGTHEQFILYGKTNTKSPQLWTDAYLAAFASAGGMQFATFDKGFKKYQGLNLELV
jgi:predicted nucleic acid-binding protein